MMTEAHENFSEYEVIQVVDDPVELSETVGKSLARGFHLVGGVSIAVSPESEIVYCQAIAK